ncbi:hypothetical protein J6590_026754 [Homalodisca vitripennis]|nr:hypothetical protein J6590_026754 [Homalodisca vitripennis]
MFHKDVGILLTPLTNTKLCLSSDHQIMPTQYTPCVTWQRRRCTRQERQDSSFSTSSLA